MKTLLLTRCYPYREEPEMAMLLEELLRTGPVLLFPVEGLRKPFYGEPVPTLPQGAQIWNGPRVSCLTAWRMRRQFPAAWRRKLGLIQSHRAAAILGGVQAIVFDLQEPLMGWAQPGWIGHDVLDEAIRQGLLKPREPELLPLR